ncbi:MAG: deoxyribodipyrimidine photo-lyase, partial [Actinobacteria bacterium]|nr:deoxyribodipyrimidine photo-lyase [Actinomycetota bacterium]
MGRIVVLFTRDLRVHDNPALAHAVRDAGEVLPLFVFDDNILNSDYARPNRVSFLVQSVEELARSLAALGADLVVRRGDVVAEAMTAVRDIGAGAIYMSADVTGYAKARHKRLTAECAAVRCDLKTWPGITVVPPGQVLPAGGDHFRVFTPYFRKWSRARLRAVEAPPGRIASPDGGETGSIPRPRDLVDGSTSPDMAAGGERAGRAAARSWLDDKLGGYDDGHNDLAADDTSRLSTFLHFGCLSPRELVEEASGRAGGESFVRQLCWRDFY